MSETVRRWPLLVAITAVSGAVAAVYGIWGVGMATDTVLLVGIASVIAAVLVLSRRPRTEAMPTPDPERRAAVPTPGADLTETIGQFLPARSRYTAVGRHVDGLRHAAMAVLTRFEGDTEATARERIETGTWTTDERAAAFLGDDDSPTGSIRETVGRRLGLSSPYEANVRRTAAAIAAIGYDGLDGSTTPNPETTTESAENRRRTTTQQTDQLHERSRRATNHWAGIGIVALGAIGVGAVAESPGIVLAGVLGIGYAGFAGSMQAPRPDLSIDRSVSDDTPDPDQDVDVTVTITNEGDGPLFDLRYVDGVPAPLAVVDGSCRLGTALRPGESVTMEYTVVAQPGTYEFDPGLAIVRGLSRSRERQFLVPAETTIVCEPQLRPTTASVPLQPTATSFAGRLTTAEGGSGTEFHSVREYRPADPLNRIDWNRRARTGELATLEFHEERGARVLVLVDARNACYVAPDEDAAHAVDRATDAAGRIVASLLEAGDTVGLAAIGPTARPGDETDADACWLAPASGTHHRLRCQEQLATHPQFSTTPPASDGRWLAQLRRIRRRLDGETQVIVLSPLTDVGSTHVARRLTSRGHPVTVISPDPTAERTAGEQLATVGRRIRRFDLQRTGIPVIDWPADESIDEALARTNVTRGQR